MAMSTSALETVADYVAEARVLLQDAVAPYRYSDLELVGALNVTLLETRRLRADLFLGQTTFPFFTAVDTTAVEIEGPFRLAVSYGLAAHAITRDQEDIQDARASVLMRTFTKILIG